MQLGKFLVGAVGGVTAVVALGGLGTYLLSGTESTSGLDAYSTVEMDGHKALSARVISGRTQSKYHPLPWVGQDVSGITCPSGLKAVAGASITCTGTAGGGRSVDIPVTVVKATSDSVTWKFER
ncbi:DUF4333 domain-containing protein [Streptomyces canus]|uniref:DUF4333 domain-containing protein n=1 Tax=Streptomyces canus TaxID=58343 RepID=UPI0036E4A2E0